MFEQSKGLLTKIPERQLSLRTRYLPALYTEPIEEPAVKRYPAWKGFVNGRQVYSLAAGINELWCATSGGILRWIWGCNALYTWFGSEHGLPGVNFDWIVLDGHGTPWVASKSRGVFYWDGQAWQQFTLAEGLPSDNISCLAVDRKGMVWLATKNGLGYVNWQADTPKWHFYNQLTVGITLLQPTCLAFSEENLLFVGTSSGLFAYIESENTWQRYTLANNLPSNQITALLCSSDKSLWVGTASGLAHITPEGIVHDLEIKVAVHSISDDPSCNLIWILASGKLWRYQGRSFERLAAPLLEEVGNLYAVAANHEKSWISSEAGVIEYKTGPALIRTPGVRDLPENGISGLAVDSQNALWVGTASGIWMYKDKEWRFLQPGNQLITPITNISCIQPISDESVWIGSWQNGNRGGLHLFRGGIEMPVDRNGTPEIVDAMALGTVFSMTGKLWAASGDRLYYQDGKEWGQTDSPEPDGLILKLLVDNQNRLWSGMSTGLYLRKRSCWTKVLNGLAVYTLSSDGSGTIWCGTSQGLYTIRGETPERLELDLTSNRIQALCLVKDTLWIGTAAGLARLENGKIQIWDTKNSGLVGQSVKALTMDADNILWVGTTSGLCQFDTSSG